MYRSLGSFRFGSVLARAFKEKARLGSARYVFEKARFLKNAQNEPKINYEAQKGNFQVCMFLVSDVYNFFALL